MRRLAAVIVGLCLAGSAPAAALDPVSQTVSISFSGDVLAHNSLYWAAETSTGYNFKPMFKPLIPTLNADINICHLETPLVDEPPTTYPVFATPTELATALKYVGFDGCSIASNHSLDQGTTGVVSTITTMKAAGLKTAGARKSSGGTSIGWYTAPNGIRIAQIAFSYGFNGRSLPSDKSWMVNRIRERDILAAASRAKAQGADVVVATLHWGTEYATRSNSMQRMLAAALTKSPNIDAVVGHHAHVLQEAVTMNGKPVVYGMGNLWSGQGPWKDQPYGQQGVVVTLTFGVMDHVAHYVSGSYVPTLTIPGSWQVMDARKVSKSSQWSQACSSIKNAATKLLVLTGPTTCPSH
jgi:poly-gamma-glutamate synthesis protein (capsule biosynthesis protein)